MVLSVSFPFATAPEFFHFFFIFDLLKVNVQQDLAVNVVRDIYHDIKDGPPSSWRLPRGATPSLLALIISSLDPPVPWFDSMS